MEAPEGSAPLGNKQLGRAPSPKATGPGGTQEEPPRRSGHHKEGTRGQWDPEGDVPVTEEGATDPQLPALSRPIHLWHSPRRTPMERPHEVGYRTAST